MIVDETSMVSLTLMSRLVEAVRPDARLVLVGDPGQLTSIEAGAVLGDIVGAGVERDGIVVLERVHRYGSGIATVAEAIRRGDADGAVARAGATSEDVTWIEADVDRRRRGRARAAARAPRSRPPARSSRRRARVTLRCRSRGSARSASCARTGTAPHGVATWMDRIERWLAAEVGGFGTEGRWYAGRPLLVTENDYGLRLYNGDTGVVVATGARVGDRGVRAPRRGRRATAPRASARWRPSTR